MFADRNLARPGNHLQEPATTESSMQVAATGSLARSRAMGNAAVMTRTELKKEAGRPEGSWGRSAREWSDRRVAPVGGWLQAQTNLGDLWSWLMIAQRGNCLLALNNTEQRKLNPIVCTHCASDKLYGICRIYRQPSCGDAKNARSGHLRDWTRAGLHNRRHRQSRIPQGGRRSHFPCVGMARWTADRVFRPRAELGEAGRVRTGASDHRGQGTQSRTGASH